MTSSRRPRRSTTRANRGSASSSSTTRGAARRSSIVSKSGTSERRAPASCASASAAPTVRGGGRSRDDERVERLLAVALLDARGCRERPARCGGRARELPRVQTDVELRQVEAEELDAARSEASRPSASRFPRFARRLRSTRSRSASNSRGELYPSAPSRCRRRTACGGTARPRSATRSAPRTPGTRARPRGSTCAARASLDERLGDAEAPGELAHPPSG